jgi:hypothetical protein
MSVVGEYFIELHVILKCILIYMRFHRGLKWAALHVIHQT